MKVSTFEHLQQIRDKFGPGIFGKIVQKLLAVAFYDAGFSHVVERGVQGVDIDAVDGDGKRYTLEVKTTDGNRITMSEENIKGLKDRAKDSYIPIIAALRMQPFEDWILGGIPVAQLQRGSFLLSRLRAYRVRALETLICSAFEAIVNQHFAHVLKGGEHYLSEILEQRRSERE